MQTGAVTVLNHFGTNETGNYVTSAEVGTLLHASEGNFYGFGSTGGIFQFNPLTNSMFTTSYNGSPEGFYAGGYSNALVEICRKPSYHQFDNDTFTICEGISFQFDLQNTNSDSYTWKKDNIIIAGQINGLLTIVDPHLGDSGTYTCEMVNECGASVTMPLHLTVEPCLGIDQAIGRKNVIKLWPNPVREVLHLEFPKGTLNVKGVAIVNLLGQIVYKTTWEVRDISVQNLPTGVYQVTLDTDKGIWTSEFVKE